MWIEEKYIRYLSSRLRNFRQVDAHTFNFSCPFCGDSLRHKKKARGYIYKKKENLNYFCHKCTAGMSASNFIKKLDPILYEEMRLELYRPREQEELPKLPAKKIIKREKSPFDGLKRVEDLDSNHPCMLFVQKRMLPYDDLFYVEKFFTWASEIVPGQFKIPPYDEDRLIIPLRNEQGEVTAFQGRKLSTNEGAKYISIKLDEDVPLIWGLNRIRKDRHILVLEGPLDAMFLPNAIACCGSDITSDLMKLGIDRDQFIIVYDNEPRAKATIKKMEKAINRDFSVCVWPESIKEKDVNDMVLKRINLGIDESSYQIWTTIKSNVHKGLSAELSLSTWAKTN